MNRFLLASGVLLLLAATATPAAAISWKDLRSKLHTWLTEPLSDALGDPYESKPIKAASEDAYAARAHDQARASARRTAAASARATADQIATSGQPYSSGEFEDAYASYQSYPQDQAYAQPAYDYFSAKMDAHHQAWSPLAAAQVAAAYAESDDGSSSAVEDDILYESSADNRPRFCGDQDCPRFDLKDTYEGIDLRTYAPSTWAWTEVEGKGAAGFDRAQIVGFQRLFKYIIGDNELEEKIDMAVPVVTAVYLNKDREIKNHFTVSFYLPFRYQVDESGSVDPPAARDKRVHITDLKKHQAYVLPFEGYSLGFRVKKLGLDFMDYVRRNIDSHIDESVFLVATYDPPYKPFDRHNEIWVLRRHKAGDEPEQK